MPTLELNDAAHSQFTTIDFFGTTYPAMLDTLRGFGDSPFQSVPFRSAENQFTTRSFQINIVGSSEATLRDNYEALLNAGIVARERYQRDPDNAVLLKVQIGTTNSNDIDYRVRDVFLSEPPGVLSTVFVNQNIVLRAVISIVTETIGQITGTGSVSTDNNKENEVDGATNNFTNFDLTDDEAELALINFKLLDSNNGGGNAWSGSNKTWIWTRQGSGHDDTTFFQNCDTTPVKVDEPTTVAPTFTSGTTGGRTTNASGGTSAYMNWAVGAGGATEETGWKQIGYFPESIAAADLPRGRFRVLARVAWEEVVGSTGYNANGTEIAFAVGYSFGGVTVVPQNGGSTASDLAKDGDAVPIGADKDIFKTIDCGEIVIPPFEVPDVLTEPTLEIRIYVHVFGTGAAWASNTEFRVSLDYFQLADIRSNFCEVDGVGTDDEIQVISEGKHTGIFKTNSSDVVQSVPTHNANIPWVQSGEGPMRFHWLRDDPSDPTNIQADFTHTAFHRTRGSF